MSRPAKTYLFGHKIYGEDRFILARQRPPPQPGDMPIRESSTDPAAFVLGWLAQPVEVAGPVDAVIGFGHFDLRIVEACAAALMRTQARLLVFTGGVGAGTMDLPGAEADCFAAAWRARSRAWEPDRLVIENKSTNTGENVRFTLKALEDHGPIKCVELVATPPRLRRVRQTWAREAGIPASASAPATSLEEERALYAARRLALEPQLAGEIERLSNYPRHGWIEPVEVPTAVRAAAARLQARP